MATRKILFRGQTRRKGETTSVSGIPLNDLDDGDRIMVDDSLYDAALDAFDEYDIEYEEV